MHESLDIQGDMLTAENLAGHLTIPADYLALDY